MRRIRLLFVTILCFVGASVLLYQSFMGLPSLSDLDKVEGVVSKVMTVERKNKHAKDTYPAVKLRERHEAFYYLDWFPAPDRIYTAVQPGDHVVILSDANSKRWIWQLEKDGKIVVDYADIKEAVADNNRFDPIFAAVLLLLGCFGVYKASRPM